MTEFRNYLPKWQQIAKIVRQRIESGEYPPGKLISERWMVDEFGVAGGTARKAIKALRDDGLVFTRVNMGSFVGPEPPEDE